MTQTTKIWITDSRGGKHWNTSCSTEYASSEARNLQKIIDQAKANRAAYSFMDIDTMRIEREDGVVMGGEFLPNMTDDELLAELVG